MQVHLYDFRWNDPTQVEFQASNGGRFGRKKLSIGDNLSIAVKSTVACGGSMRDNVWQACPQQVTGRKKCDTCRNREGNFVFTSFDGFNTDMFTSDDLARLQGPHVVYLALFNEGLKKVGVSKSSRKTLRQVEQGSHQTLFIAETTDGILARQLETCFRQSGLADKIQANAKKDFICPEINESQGEAELNQFLLEKPEFIDWSDTFGITTVKNHSKPLHVVKLAEDESVSGTIIGLKGPFIMLETPDEIVAICAKDLQGLQLDFTPTEAGLSLNSALQNALF